MYKLLPDQFGQEAKCIKRLADNAYIPFDPANTDYQTFKAQINAQVATLQDADGKAMSADEAIAFVSTFP